MTRQQDTAWPHQVDAENLSHRHSHEPARTTDLVRARVIPSRFAGTVPGCVPREKIWPLRCLRVPQPPDDPDILLFNFPLASRPTDTVTQTDVLYEQSAAIATVTLNRPECRNALGLAVIESLEQVLTRISHDPSIRVVILAAAGPVFCSGHDLRELAGATPEQCHRLFSTCARMMLALRNLPQPVIARVQGLATAAGCQLAATCDLVVAAEEARFATPGLKIGLFCTTPMVPLVRVMPAKLALEMLLTAEPISASRALEGGLVNRVVPADQLVSATWTLAETIARSCPEVVALGKRAFYRQLPLDEPAAYDDAVPVITANATHPAACEGIAAFLEKRTPCWSEPQSP